MMVLVNLGLLIKKSKIKLKLLMHINIKKYLKYYGLQKWETNKKKDWSGINN